MNEQWYKRATQVSKVIAVKSLVAVLSSFAVREAVQALCQCSGRQTLNSKHRTKS